MASYYPNSQCFVPYQQFTPVDMNFGGASSVELSRRISENFGMKDVALENFMASQQPAASSSLTNAHYPIASFHLDRLDQALPVTHSISSSSTASPRGGKRKVNEHPERSSTTVTGLTGSAGITKKRNGSRKGKKKVSIDKEVASNPEEVIHVRSRRGQATDSHSLSERVRREKINSKLRCLQEIVPGCCKKMGMALMLEEIINYVYSLQNQVEFLSMELTAASTSTLYESNMLLQGTSTHGIGIEQRQKTEKLPYGEHAYLHWTGSI